MTPSTIKVVTKKEANGEAKKLYIFDKGPGFLQLTRISRLNKRDTDVAGIINSNQYVEDPIKTARTEHQIESRIVSKTLEKVRPSGMRVTDLIQPQISSKGFYLPNDIHKAATQPHKHEEVAAMDDDYFQNRENLDGGDLRKNKQVNYQITPDRNHEH